VLSCPVYRRALNPWNWTSWNGGNSPTGERLVFGFGMNPWPYRSADVTSLATAADDRSWYGSVDHIATTNPLWQLRPRWTAITAQSNRVLLTDSNDQLLSIQPGNGAWENANAVALSKAYHFDLPVVSPSLAGSDAHFSEAFFPSDRHRSRINVAYYDGRVGNCAVSRADGFELMLGVCYPDQHKGF
jgi:prepilin-type processing-associated H-X9-DG protein